ncbi:hypothetical protein O181_046823 [Austropuccinia psidii MF-1]|uniref:Uncharacterized protein n=1 Tax=Austropuccinia psidii MF-1 TaxID=1389203 RepID=A0A9Q3DT35_9BASI|nr:hypothetical protein [Austropuccinia psidii MF-1]
MDVPEFKPAFFLDRPDRPDRPDRLDRLRIAESSRESNSRRWCVERGVIGRIWAITVTDDLVSLVSSAVSISISMVTGHVKEGLCPRIQSNSI